MPLGAGSVMKVVVSAVLDGSDVFNHVFHARITNVPTATDQAIIDALRDHMVAAYIPLSTSVAVGLLGSEVSVAESVGANNFIEVGTASFAGWGGGSAVESTPTTSAPTVQFSVAGQGRKGRKSFYPVTVGNVEGSILGTTTIAGLLTWGLNFTGEIDLGVVLVRFGVYKPANGTLADFSGTVTVNSILGTMVTRKIGRGQ